MVLARQPMEEIHFPFEFHIMYHTKWDRLRVITPENAPNQFVVRIAIHRNQELFPLHRFHRFTERPGNGKALAFRWKVRASSTQSNQHMIASPSTGAGRSHMESRVVEAVALETGQPQT
jgi:chromosomal replication initiation ATPase DnaA